MMLTLAMMQAGDAIPILGVMGLAGLAALYVAFMPKPGHAEPLCAKCGYVITGLAAGVPCPECGSELQGDGISEPVCESRSAIRRAIYLLVGLALLWVPVVVCAYEWTGVRTYVDATHRFQPRSNIFQDVELTWRETARAGIDKAANVSSVELVLTLNDGRKVDRRIRLGDRTPEAVAAEVGAWLRSGAVGIGSAGGEGPANGLAAVVASAFGGLRSLDTMSIEFQTIAASSVRTSERPVWLSFLFVVAVPVSLIVGLWRIIRVVGEEPGSSR